MLHYKYLLVGGGMTADAATRGIREVDPSGTIGLIGDEPHSPYNRPPLSKGLWKGKPVEQIWRGTEQHGVDLYLGHRACALDIATKQVVDEQGTVYTFDRLLLATGGSPRRLPFGDDHIIYYRTVSDYERLRRLADRGQRFAVIGGGFIGSEIAAALAERGKDVSMVFPEDAICSNVFPHDLGQYLNRFFRQKQIQVFTGDVAAGLEQRGKQFALRTRGGHELVVDSVVAGIGIQLNVALAREAGLTVNNGIVVDQYLNAGSPDIFAAGDVANFYSSALGKRLRVEHEDNANTMGRQAGRNMAGACEPYDYLPFFYSDLFDLGYEAVGELDSRLETVADWKEPYREGVLYYLHGGRVRGVLLWNVWHQVQAARSLITERGPFWPERMKGKLPV